ncbi:MAG: hypothetical protein QM610_06585 [Chitinophagaceae bacterium]
MSYLLLKEKKIVICRLFSNAIVHTEELSYCDFTIFLKSKLTINDFMEFYGWYGEPINMTEEDLAKGEFDIMVWDKNTKTNYDMAILPDRYDSGMFIIQITNMQCNSYINDLEVDNFVLE